MRPPMSARVENEGRLPPLDGIRGFAVLAVMAYHFVHGMSRAHPIDAAVFDAASYGWVGVDLFFALSGFLITGVLLDSKDDARYFRRFYLRRAVRIFPLYYGFLFLFFVVAPNVVGRSSWILDSERPYRLWYWTYAANVSQELRGGGGVLGHFWTLAVEEQFYLVWPMVVRLLPRRALIGVGFLSVAGGYVLRRLVPHEPDLHLALKVVVTDRAEGLVLGAAVAAAFRERGGVAYLRRFAPIVFFAAIGWCVATAIFEADFVRRAGIYAAMTTPVALASSAAVAYGATAARSAPIARALSCGPLRFVGDHSYAMYVFHPVVFALIAPRFDIDLFPKVGGSELIGRAALVLTCTMAVVAAAYLSGRFWEKPWLRLKKRI
jgi:peptidoglycan/LPS O-acetylase OafA/YrhL